MKVSDNLLLIGASLAMFTALACQAFGQSPAVSEDETHHVVTYNSSSHPQYYQSVIRNNNGTFFWPRMRDHFNTSPSNIRGRLLSNPNTQHPWYNPAGTDRLKPGSVMVKRTLRIPKGEAIEVFQERASYFGRPNTPRTLYRWTYPVGTIVQEQLTFKGVDDCTINRQREKLSDDKWSDGDEEIIGTPPARYEQTKVSCISCHKDAGVHVDNLRGDFPGRDWYGHARGNNTIFTFRPINIHGQIWDWAKPFVRYKQG